MWINCHAKLIEHNFTLKVSIHFWLYLCLCICCFCPVWWFIFSIKGINPNLVKCFLTAQRICFRLDRGLCSRLDRVLCCRLIRRAVGAARAVGSALVARRCLKRNISITYFAFVIFNYSLKGNKTIERMNSNYQVHNMKMDLYKLHLVKICCSLFFSTRRTSTRGSTHWRLNGISEK